MVIVPSDFFIPNVFLFLFFLAETNVERKFRFGHSMTNRQS